MPDRPRRAAPGATQYRERILFTVAGLTPQSITETIHALAVRSQPAFVPTRLVVLTTAIGASRVRLSLLSKEPGWLARLCADCNLAPIALAEDDLIVVKDHAGAVLDDLRTEDDNMRAADAIVSTIAKLTERPDSAPHVSIAGGRKTMGYFAGYGLSLYGRPQDRPPLWSARLPAGQPPVAFGREGAARWQGYAEEYLRELAPLLDLAKREELGEEYAPGRHGSDDVFPPGEPFQQGVEGGDPRPPAGALPGVTGRQQEEPVVVLVPRSATQGHRDHPGPMRLPAWNFLLHP